MSRIDYSKWDKIQDSDSEEGEEDDDGSYPRAPQVTKLDAPMSVTFGGGSGECQITSTTGNKPATIAPPQGPAGPPPPAPLPKPTSSGSPVAVDDSSSTTLNGGEGPGYLWSQSREEVVIRIWVPQGTKAKDLKVELLQGGKGRESTCKLRIESQSKGMLFEETLVNAVKTVDEDTGLDWELEDAPGDSQCRRRVKVSLIKDVPQAGLVHWWSQAFQGGPAIDTTKIQGRKGNFQAAWEEAQTMFKKSVAERQPMIVDLGGEEEEEKGEEEGEGT